MTGEGFSLQAPQEVKGDGIFQMMGGAWCLVSLQSISHAQDLLRRGLLQNAAITAISKEAIEEVAIDQDHDGQDAVRGHR